MHVDQSYTIFIESSMQSPVHWVQFTFNLSVMELIRFNKSAMGEIISGATLVRTRSEWGTAKDFYFVAPF